MLVHPIETPHRSTPAVFTSLATSPQFQKDWEDNSAAGAGLCGFLMTNSKNLEVTSIFFIADDSVGILRSQDPPGKHLSFTDLFLIIPIPRCEGCPFVVFIPSE